MGWLDKWLTALRKGVPDVMAWNPRNVIQEKIIHESLTSSEKELNLN